MPYVPLCPGSTNATSVTGEPVNFKGIFLASIRIGSNVAFQDFYVASGFQHDCVLGTDFLTREGLTLNVSACTLKWNSETTSMGIDGPEPTSEMFPPRSEMFVMLPIGPGCSTGLFEMNESLCQSSHVYAARSIVMPEQGEIPVRLVNPGYDTVTIEPSVNIGRVTSVTDIATMQLEHNSKDSIADSLDLSSAGLSSEQQVKLSDVLNKYSDVFCEI